MIKCIENINKEKMLLEKKQLNSIELNREAKAEGKIRNCNQNF